MRRDTTSPAVRPLAAMPIKRADRPGLTILTLGLMISAFAPTASPSFAQARSAPDNAHARSYGDGWECARTFRREGTACVPVVVPANAHLNRTGNRWACNKNFQRSRGNACSTNRSVSLAIFT